MKKLKRLQDYDEIILPETIMGEVDYLFGFVCLAIKHQDNIDINYEKRCLYRQIYFWFKSKIMDLKIVKIY